MSREKMIVVSDNDSLCRFLFRFLSEHGFDVYCGPADHSAVVHLIRAHAPTLIMVDMTTSAKAGIDLCTEIRRFSDSPILLVCAGSEEALTISGLSAGGDDYICTPFNRELLLAQVQALIRRYKGAFPVNQRHLLHFPGLEIDLSSQSVTSHGQETVLSAKEFQLLVLLAKHPNRIFHIESLYDLIWSDSKLGDLRTVMVHIYNLRQKIEINPSEPFYIHTVRGAGYKFNGKAAQ
ncbi:response regulator transcription factor [Fontibacillus sp. BL9]|uniref:response regulator transcription factor n=1 Tax=Fontibacillus sp. BL9 TaxID=3389971 RepID=UPI00397C4BA2